MAFTSADLDAIDRGIAALASGTQAIEVRAADGSTVKYNPGQAGDLMKLRAFVAGQVATASADPATTAGGVTYAEWSRA